MAYRKIVVTDINGVETVFADVAVTFEHNYIKIRTDGGFKVIPYVSIRTVGVEELPRTVSELPIGGIRG